MRKTVKTISLTAALAVMIPLSAYAATTMTAGSDTPTASNPSTSSPAVPDTLPEGKHRAGFGKEAQAFSQEVLDLLKLDQAAVREKLAEGKTLADIGAEQGVSREALKQALTDANNKRLEEQKQAFADNLDNLIDRKGGLFPSDRMKGKAPGMGMKGVPGTFIARDLTAAAAVLGLTEDELKTALVDGKSLADLAKEKNIDVQKLVDAQAAAITDAVNEALKDGKITQEQADRQLANAADRAEKIVNDTHARRGPGMRGGREGHGHGIGGDAGGPAAKADS